MDRLSAPQQNRLLAGLSNLLRRVEQDSGPEFLPRGLDVMGLVRQLALPSAETVEKMSYGDPLFRMPTQSNIPITTDRGYLAEVLGMLPAVPAASRATTRLSNEAADALVRQITGRSDATAMRALEEIGQMSPVPQITTYHGSPYLFRQFDPARVGTGEGAQAYGVGAGYTAEARPVAEGYRQAISKDKFLTQEGIFEPSSLEHLNVKATLRKDGLEKAIEVARKSAVPDEDYPEVAAKAARDLEVLERIKESGGIQPIPGYLYKGEIPDEIIPRFLNWDEPLTKDAPQEVKDSFNSILQKYPELKEPFFKAFRANKPGSHYYAILNDYAKTGDLYKNQLFASKVLEDAGIRGIRYLDQGSRGEGKGTSNFIPFSPEDYRIQEINDRPVGEFFPGLLEPQAGARPMFETGREVTFPFIKNTEKAPKTTGFAQEIEPAGNYILSGEDVDVAKLPQGWTSGEVTFKNPLVLDWGKSGLYSEPDNWKQVLSSQYGGKTGKALSRAVAKDGYDGIVTINEYGPSEIVDLTMFAK